MHGLLRLKNKTYLTASENSVFYKLENDVFIEKHCFFISHYFTSNGGGQ